MPLITTFGSGSNKSFRASSVAKTLYSLSQTFYSSGTYTVPSGITKLAVF